jgi:16S rRNA processing protein RimM
MIGQFIIGRVGAPFGLKGQVKVRPFSGEIEHLLTLESVILRRDGTEQVLRIEESAPMPPAALLKFAGIDSPEAVKKLQGAELLVDRAQASPLGPGEFYIEDLRGLRVLAADTGETLGHITDILEGGGGELAEIKLASGALKLVPFREEFLTGVSPEQGQVILLHRWILE